MIKSRIKIKSLPSAKPSVLNHNLILNLNPVVQ